MFHLYLTSILINYGVNCKTLLSGIYAVLFHARIKGRALRQKNGAGVAGAVSRDIL